MILAHRIALDPTVAQANAFARACGVARFAWNWALAEWDRQYHAGAKPTALKLKREWNAIKAERFPWVYESPKGANQQPFANLQKAFRRFFQKKAARPTFKRKGAHDAFYIENDQFVIEGAVAHLPKIGTVRMREALRFVGTVMGATVSRTADRWFLSVQVDVGTSMLQRAGDATVGVDVGLTTFATLSTGEKIVAPKPLATALRQLSRAQRVMARRQRGSHRRAKAKARVARIHRRVHDVRADFLHKLSTRLCRENQTVAVENLNVSGMVRNRPLARAISDAGWAEFRRQLGYKATRYGTRLVVVDRWFPSSKTCAACGVVKEVLALRERQFACEACGVVADRDMNAATNLRTLGLRGNHARGPEGADGGCMADVKPRRDEARAAQPGRLLALDCSG